MIKFKCCSCKKPTTKVIEWASTPEYPQYACFECCRRVFTPQAFYKATGIATRKYKKTAMKSLLMGRSL